MKWLVYVMTFGLIACSSQSNRLDPIQEQKIQPFLGTWYEIVRQDHAFEEGLTNVTATYSLQKDDTITVLNKGYSALDRDWREARGKASYVASSNAGHLKVSFFGPFYGAYVIFELDSRNPQYATIAGPNKEFFWLLSRRPQMPVGDQQRILREAMSLGFSMDKLVQVSHAKVPTPKTSLND
ncbi:lipocalin family protein [Marinomonas sp.]